MTIAPSEDADRDPPPPPSSSSLGCPRAPRGTCGTPRRARTGHRPRTARWRPGTSRCSARGRSRTGARGWPRAAARLPPEQQQHLVAGVGDRVDALREHRGRSGEEEREELHDRDARVGEQRRHDRLGAAFGRHRGSSVVVSVRALSWCDATSSLASPGRPAPAVVVGRSVDGRRRRSQRPRRDAEVAGGVGAGGQQGGVPRHVGGRRRWRPSRPGPGAPAAAATSRPRCSRTDGLRRRRRRGSPAPGRRSPSSSSSKGSANRSCSRGGGDDRQQVLGVAGQRGAAAGPTHRLRDPARGPGGEHRAAPDQRASRRRARSPASWPG